MKKRFGLWKALCRLMREAALGRAACWGACDAAEDDTPCTPQKNDSHCSSKNHNF